MNRIFSRVAASLGVACLVLAPLPGESSKAGCRAVRVHHHAHQQAAVVFQPVYQQPYWYQVGANYQVAAIVQETLKAQQLLAQQQLQAPQQAAPCPTCPTPQSMPLTAPTPLPLTTGKCVSCHSGTNADATAALNLSDLGTLDCESKLLMIREAVSGRMPKGRPLSAQELGDFIGEMAGEPPAK